jgi:hypothetical protein
VSMYKKHFMVRIPDGAADLFAYFYSASYPEKPGEAGRSNSCCCHLPATMRRSFAKRAARIGIRKAGERARQLAY